MYCELEIEIYYFNQLIQSGITQAQNLNIALDSSTHDWSWNLVVWNTLANLNKEVKL